MICWLSTNAASFCTDANQSPLYHFCLILTTRFLFFPPSSFVNSALLVFPPSVNFMLAFLGCLKAGIVAVPCFPPNPARKDTLLMFSRITESSGAKFVLTSHDYNHLKKLAGVKDIFTKFTSSRQQQQQAAATATWPEQLEWIITDRGGGGGGCG